MTRHQLFQLCVKHQLTLFQTKAACILQDLNGDDNALEYVNGIVESHGKELDAQMRLPL